MKVPSLRLVLPAALLSLVLTGAGRADEDDPRATRVAAPHGKVEYCGYCHGASGQGYRAYFTMPRIAGQTEAYLVNQLAAYANGRRRNTFMHSAMRGLSPSMREALARHFSKLGAKSVPHDSGSGHAEGRTIFLDGLPNENIPACAACHGTSGEGYGPIPRVAGQLPSYVETTLANWNERGHEEHADVMGPIARLMSKSQVAAVAAYLSALK